MFSGRYVLKTRRVAVTATHATLRFFWQKEPEGILEHYLARLLLTGYTYNSVGGIKTIAPPSG
jgi:hypothetical protein